MLSRKAIALDVDNLTDARYFAAWGVTHIAFSYDPKVGVLSSIAKYKEIMAWCEGIDFLLTYHADSQESDIQQLLAVLPIKGVVTNTESIQILGVEQRLHIWDKSQTYQDQSVIVMDDVAEVPELQKNNEVYLILNADTLAQLQEDEDLGIILQGSEEEKVGFKSFDELNTLLEQM